MGIKIRSKIHDQPDKPCRNHENSDSPDFPHINGLCRSGGLRKQRFRRFLFPFLFFLDLSDDQPALWALPGRGGYLRGAIRAPHRAILKYNSMGSELEDTFF
jgi:hypothetical protein